MQALYPHAVPNVLLGKFDGQHMVRVFFPDLYDEDRPSVSLTQEELTMFYDKGIRPAVLLATPGSAHDWPSNHADEMFRARKLRHGFTVGSKIISKDDIHELSHHLQSCLANNIPWGHNVVFGTQVRGVKGGTYHSMTEFQAGTALENFLEDLDTRFGTWYIDVGVELIDLGRALLWRTDAHSLVAQHVLGINRRTANRITTPGRTCTRDLSSHLMDISGFRSHITTTNGGPYESVFIQIYTTDKSATYHPHGTHSSKYITVQMAMKGTPPAFCTGLEHVYRSAATTKNVAARVEVRVPLRHACAVLMNISDNVIRQSLVSFSQNIWW